jgi:hypothetical protein
MGRIILGAVIGFIVWTALLLSTDWIWTVLAPDWYGRHQFDLQLAITNRTPFMADSLVLIIAVMRSAIFSLVMGYIAALISRETFKSPLLLGIFLFAFGSLVSVMAWNHLPLWYHFGILLPLIPLTLLGGRLKK